MTALLLALSIVGQSAFTIDSYQTRNWIDGTRQRPVRLGDGITWESNPLLEGRPAEAPRYFEWMKLAAEAGTTSSYAWEIGAAVALTVADVATVALNNQTLMALGRSPYAGLGFRVRF